MRAIFRARELSLVILMMLFDNLDDKGAHKACEYSCADAIGGSAYDGGKARGGKA